MKRNYRVDFASMTLYITKEFSERMYDATSAEYKTYKRLVKDLPNLTIEHITHRSPSNRKSKRGLTYKNMKDYILLYKNANELLKMFALAITLSKIQPSPYAFVKRWFLEQFPDYENFPSLSDTCLITIPIVPREEKEIEMVA